MVSVMRYRFGAWTVCNVEFSVLMALLRCQRLLDGLHMMYVFGVVSLITTIMVWFAEGMKIISQV